MGGFIEHYIILYFTCTFCWKSRVDRSRDLASTRDGRREERRNLVIIHPRLSLCSFILGLLGQVGHGFCWVAERCRGCFGILS